MTVPALLVALYPPAVRQRWGADLARAVAESGPRSWPDTLRGAARLWLHPGDWPETTAGQTRRVLAVALFAVVALATLLLRAAEPTTSLTADSRHPLTSVWLVPVLAGLALAAPLPTPAGWSAPAALRRLCAATVRTLAPAAFALAALYLAAHSVIVEHPDPAARAAFVGYYWVTLGFTGFRLCTLVARVTGLGGLVAVAGTRRLRVSLLLVGAGLAAACCQSLAGVLLSPFDVAGLLLAAALTVPAAAALTAGLNLRAAA
jgi:hypothetical protein